MEHFDVLIGDTHSDEDAHRTAQQQRSRADA
jgi:hypothetical protein